MAKDQSAELSYEAAKSQLDEIVTRLEDKDLPLDDPATREPDITFASQNLNWKPIIQFEQGLELTISYFRQELASI